MAKVVRWMLVLVAASLTLLLVVHTLALLEEMHSLTRPASKHLFP